ncbi:hypothetical protein J6590_095619 [Homalodisca vitripennis]|nr:hypothetical protein J6590_095619 [Homalodisca vitripennis]
MAPHRHNEDNIRHYQAHSHMVAAFTQRNLFSEYKEKTVIRPTSTWWLNALSGISSANIQGKDRYQAHSHMVAECTQRNLFSAYTRKRPLPGPLPHGEDRYQAHSHMVAACTQRNLLSAYKEKAVIRPTPTWWLHALSGISSAQAHSHMVAACTQRNLFSAIKEKTLTINRNVTDLRRRLKSKNPSYYHLKEASNRALV